MPGHHIVFGRSRGPSALSRHDRYPAALAPHPDLLGLHYGARLEHFPGGRLAMWGIMPGLIGSNIGKRRHAAVDYHPTFVLQGLSVLDDARSERAFPSRGSPPSFKE
jgi:hypothetical protein